MKYDAFEFKSDFNKLLHSKIGHGKNWAKELSKLLHCTESTIYKKTRQDSFFTIEEMLFLIKYYSLDVSSILSDNKGIVKFKVPSIQNPIRSIHAYLSQFIHIFSSLELQSDTHIFYASREIPIFFYFNKPELALFKLFVFAKSIWKLDTFKNSTFSFNLFQDSDCLLISQLWIKYSQIKSTEYWNTKILDSTLQQINFYIETGDLSIQDSLTILNRLKELILELKEMAINKAKSNPGHNNFFLYENKILHTSNHILAKSRQKSVIYITYDSPNFIYSDDTEFINYSEKWYKNIEETSYLLGNGSGHITGMFFSQLSSSVDQLIHKIKLINS